MRFIVRSLLLLLLVNGLLLYMHYNEAGNAKGPDESQSTYVQEIEVTNRSDALYVRHHFIGLSDNRHEIMWPEKSIERSCYMGSQYSCDRLNEEATAFLEGGADRQSIQYVIPTDGQMKQSAFFQDIFARLDYSGKASTLFHLIDETQRGGLWVNGLELVGRQQMDLVDYSFFRGDGIVTDLYWQQQEQPLAYSGTRLAVFASNVDNELIQEADTALNKFNIPYSVIILNGDKSPIRSHRFAVLHPDESFRMEDILLVNGFAERFSLEDQPLLAEVVTSIIGEKAVGAEKSRSMYIELEKELSETEKMQFIRFLGDYEGLQLDASTLDELLEKVTGFKTAFFEKNTNDVKLYPLLLQDSREVHLEGEENSEMAVILKDGKTLYPITPMMRHLGYEVTSNERSLYIENEARKFRFPMKEFFYVYNERRYNVKSMPFVQIGDEFYFEETALIRIFLLSVEKASDRIDITPIATFGKEGEHN